jgi:hypothetical protein
MDMSRGLGLSANRAHTYSAGFACIRYAVSVSFLSYNIRFRQFRTTVAKADLTARASDVVWSLVVAWGVEVAKCQGHGAADTLGKRDVKEKARSDKIPVRATVQQKWR